MMILEWITVVLLSKINVLLQCLLLQERSVNHQENGMEKFVLMAKIRHVLLLISKCLENCVDVRILLSKFPLNSYKNDQTIMACLMHMWCALSKVVTSVYFDFCKQFNKWNYPSLGITKNAVEVHIINNSLCLDK